MTTTAAQLIARAKARALWPTENAPLTDAEILSLADEEILGTLWPILLKSQGDHYLSVLDYPITANYSRYRQPNNAIRIKDVLLVDEDGEEGDSLNFVNIEELGRLGNDGDLVAYIDGDFLGLHPRPELTQHTLRIRYYRAPSALTLEGVRVGAVSLPSTIAIDEDDTPTHPATFFTPAADDELDIVSGGNTHQLLCDRFTVDNFALGAILFEEELDGSGVQEGDWISYAGRTPIVQVPDHMVPLLIQRLKLAMVDAHGDNAAFQRTASMLQPLTAAASSTTSPRTEAEPKTITGHLSSRAAFFGGRRRW